MAGIVLGMRRLLPPDAAAALFGLAAALLLVAGCAGPSTPPPDRDLELSYLRPVVAADLLDYAHLEIPALENVKVVPDGGDGHLGLRTYGGQPRKNNGVRAEISVDYPYREGETVRYPTRGETWDGFPTNSPPIALGYGQVDGRDSLAFVYGAPESKTIGLVPISRGRWHDITVRVTWSRGSTGAAALYLDGAPAPAQTATGPNMHNGYQHYLKVGTYRHPDIKCDAWVYVDAVTITREPGPARSS